MPEMPKELRCPGKLHGIMQSPELLEVQCTRRRCGKRSGVVVLHTINIKTGDIVNTRVFRNPPLEERNKDNGSR